MSDARGQCINNQLSIGSCFVCFVSVLSPVPSRCCITVTNCLLDQVILLLKCLRPQHYQCTRSEIQPVTLSSELPTGQAITLPTELQRPVVYRSKHHGLETLYHRMCVDTCYTFALGLKFKCK